MRELASEILANGALANPISDSVLGAFQLDATSNGVCAISGLD